MVKLLFKQYGDGNQLIVGSFPLEEQVARRAAVVGCQDEAHYTSLAIIDPWSKATIASAKLPENVCIFPRSTKALYESKTGVLWIYLSALPDPWLHWQDLLHGRKVDALASLQQPSLLTCGSLVDSRQTSTKDYSAGDAPRGVAVPRTRGLAVTQAAYGLGADLVLLDVFHRKLAVRWPIYLACMPQRGRHWRARRDLPAGTLVLEESVFVHVLERQAMDHHCWDCCKVLSDDDAHPKPASSKCQTAVYCSDDCEQADALQHQLESELLQNSSARGVNNDFLRLVLRALARLHLGDPSLAPDGAAVFAALAASFADATDSGRTRELTWMDGIKVSEGLKDQVRKKEKNLSYWAEQVAKILPHLDPTVVRGVVLRVHCNMMASQDERGQRIGSAVALWTSFFNHDCNANCVCFVDGKNVRVTTLRPVDKDDELTICYIDPFVSPARRQQSLLLSKGFLCMCSQCDQPIQCNPLQQLLCYWSSPRAAVLPYDQPLQLQQEWAALNGDVFVQENDLRQMERQVDKVREISGKVGRVARSASYGWLQQALTRGAGQTRIKCCSPVVNDVARQMQLRARKMLCHGRNRASEQ